MKEFLVFQALPFVIDHHNALLFGLWAMGASAVVYLFLSRWWKEDAKEAASYPGVKDEVEIYAKMKEVARSKRGLRLKQLAIQSIFWPFFAGGKVGRKLGSLVFYPLILAADRVKSNAIKNALEHPTVVNVIHHGKGVVNAVNCRKCGVSVATMAPHQCNVNAPMPVNARRSGMTCGKCGLAVSIREGHRCDSYSSVPSPVRSRQDEPDDDSHCNDCDMSYDSNNESHPVQFCRDCNENHCVEAGCA